MKSIIKGMSKSELCKEQIKRRSAFYNNNKKNFSRFFFNPVMKIERYTSLAHLHLLSTKKDSALNFYRPVQKPSLCFVGLDWLTSLPFICSPARLFENSFLFLSAQPEPFEKSLVMCQPKLACPIKKKSPLICQRVLLKKNQL